MKNVKVNIKLNGRKFEREVEPRTLLLDFVREFADLTATHMGCDTSNCGACTVLLDGKPVKSCTVLAVQADDREVRTLEGLGEEPLMKRLKEEFIEKHGLQCGFCTSGMLISSYSLLRKKSDPNEKEIREAISGNICRCTGYHGIVEAVKSVKGETAREKLPESPELVRR